MIFNIFKKIIVTLWRKTRGALVGRISCQLCVKMLDCIFMKHIIEITINYGNKIRFT